MYAHLYYADVDTTFREDVEMKMTNLFKQTKFNTCHGYLRRQLADYADKFGRLKASAILLYEHEHVRTTISNEGIRKIAAIV